MNVYIFDVDGVITNPQEKQIKENKILDEISQKLEKSIPVAFNTGRTLTWVIDRVIHPLLLKINDKTILQNLFIVGEKGGVWLTFDQKGQMHSEKDDSILMTRDLQNKLRALAENEFKDYVFYDNDKQTMITLEVKDDVSLEAFNRIHPALNKRISEILEKEDPEGKFKLTPTTLDTDIENKFVGKGFAVNRILKWLRERKLNPKKFIAFGDSGADIEMAEEINKQGYSVIYVYVGNKTKPEKNKYPFEIVYTQNYFDKGTLEYLTSNIT
jgi:HAD superfamily hydrolase (TIGR01484 family)